MCDVKCGAMWNAAISDSVMWYMIEILNVMWNMAWCGMWCPGMRNVA